MNNIAFVKKSKLCTGCGICEDVCPKHCITIRCTGDENRPVIDERECLGDKCGRCLKVCPGIGVNLEAMSKELYQEDEILEDKFIGRYIALHSGYSKDNNIRYHSASGGVVSQFLIFLLEKKIVDGAVVTGFDDDHITPMSYVARTKEEVVAAKSSKYCPVALNKVGNEIAQSEGKYVIVGLPCHIQGFRKRAEIDRKFREKVVGFFAIYCSSNRTFGARNYLLEKYNIKKEDVTYFAFRDDGCLGNLKILTHQNATTIKIPFSQYYGRMLRSFFKPHRCLTCIDHYGELADICFGDIHIKPYSDDKVGVSSWIVRSEKWEQLFVQAATEGYIQMEDIAAKVLNDSQAAMLYPKKRRAGAVVRMDWLMGLTPPKYDKPFEHPSAKDYVSEIICHCQRFVGRHKNLWFLINMLNRK